jgi:hypothetical protein
VAVEPTDKDLELFGTEENWAMAGPIASLQIIQIMII